MPIQRLDTLLALKAMHLTPGLNANDRRVAAALLEHFNRRTGQCDPSLERIAELLGISTRTVIRSNHRLERAGLFKKTRHGGHSNRNFYEPMWSRFREIEAAWSARFNSRANSAASEVSPARRQACHLEGDNRVTETCGSNLLKETYQRGHPKEAKGRGAESQFGARGPTTGVRSRDAAETAAERRWNDALHEQFRSLPQTYGEVIEAITPEIQAAATDAEMRCHGAGLAYILNRLRIPSTGSSANPER
jgi:predicted transcriptional regulator